MREYRISIYTRGKKLRWQTAYENGRVALHAAFAQLEKYPGENVDMPFGLSVIHLKEKTPCATTTA